MVKEHKSMLNHLNIIAFSNYSPNSQNDQLSYSKLTHISPTSNMTIMKSSPTKKLTSLNASQSIHSTNNHIQHLSHQITRNGHSINIMCGRSNDFSSIYEVYSNNLLEGSRLIRQLAKCSDIVAIDTEFPGVVCRINGEYTSTTSLSYHNIKCNTDLMNPIQIGFSFFNQNGEQSEVNATVQFNLKWDMECEVFAEDSIVLLENSGIDFHEHKIHGIEPHDFAEMFLGSGLPLNDKITWIGFHCAYDWAYMMKICTNLPDIPESYEEFNDLFLLYFPKTIDIKTIMTDKNLPKSGLQDLARNLNVERIGMQHQAGSDAKLTGDAFFNFFKTYCNSMLEEKYINQIYGLNYCPSSGVNMLWLPNQSPVPDEIEAYQTQINRLGGIINNGSAVNNTHHYCHNLLNNTTGPNEVTLLDESGCANTNSCGITSGNTTISSNNGTMQMCYCHHQHSYTTCSDNNNTTTVNPQQSQTQNPTVKSSANSCSSSSDAGRSSSNSQNDDSLDEEI